MIATPRNAAALASLAGLAGNRTPATALISRGTSPDPVRRARLSLRLFGKQRAATPIRIQNRTLAAPLPPTLTANDA